MVYYRELWTKHYGSIPVDEYGRSYEIHHIDGNRKNNTLDNLKCLSIQVHYELHKKQGDYKAAWAIAQRLTLNADELLDLRKRYKKVEISKESRDKMSAAQLGKRVSQETRERMSIAQKNRQRKPLSEETKAKISNTLSDKKRQPHSDETKKKIGAAIKKANTGRHLTEEHKNNISKAMKGKGAGKKLSEETKQKLRKPKKRKQL